MRKQIEIFHINAFTSKPFRGNPAAVLLSDSLNKIQMQLIAKETKFSETAFLKQLSPNIFELRWFSPTNEVMLCGHATIAALHYLKEKDLLDEDSDIIFKTKSGNLKAGISSGKYWMSIPTISFEKLDYKPGNLLKFIGVDKEKLLTDIYLSNNRYLFIGVDNITTLLNLKPDFNKLLSLTKPENIFTDITVFTLCNSDNTIANLRFFAPFDGINEDPATGSAAGILLKMLYELNLIKNFSDDKIYTFKQGESLNRKSKIGASYNSKSNSLKIYGEAVTVLKGNILI